MKNFSNEINRAEVRPMAVAGQFYPGDADELKAMLGSFFAGVPAAKSKEPVQAVIVPHAGYVFSGGVAARAFARVPEEKRYDNIFLIGPSHHVFIDGASVCTAFSYYQTPLGLVPVNRQTCNELLGHDGFCYKPEAHDREHCLEVQLPFLQYRLDELSPIVPVIVGTQNLHRLEQIAEALKPYFNERNLFVISSDFSHYPSYEDALVADRHTGEGVESGNLRCFVDALEENEEKHYRNLVTSACGQSAIAVLLLLSQNEPTLAISHLGYANSGDSPYGGHDQVVGYHAFVMERGEGFSLNDSEKKALLRLARHTIAERLGVDSGPVEDMPASLTQCCGAFVTLTEHGRLRGCIGHFGEDMPLCDVVREMAGEAAFEDPRFSPLSKEELNDVSIEISVLTPLKRIADASEFCLHRDGIYIRKGGRGGTFLPQVADEVNWTKEEFLGHCSQDKAGLGWDGWRDAELYTYRAIIFHE